MPQIINTNIASLNAQRNLNRTQGALEISLQRLSSGLRINSAKDDAAGLAISERFTTQIRGLNQAIRNANDGISFSQVAEGALSTVGDSLQRIREIAVQAINDTNSPADRQALNNEVQQLIAEVNRIGSSTQFNGQNILDGSLGDLTFQVGANQGQTIVATGVDARGTQLGAAVAEGDSIDVSTLTFPLTDVTVQGISVDLTSTANLTDVVSEINELASSTGVFASRASTTVAALGFLTPADTTVEINGVEIAALSADTESVRAARFNTFSAQTGVTAEGVDGSGVITLTSGLGADIDIDDTNATFAASATYSFSAGIVLSADVGTTVSVAGTDAAALGSLGAASTVDFTLNNTNVLNGSNANDALRTIDFALQQVSGFRAELGAVQIRFEATISNLEVQSENTSAARSRILDADFAAETAALTRATILQQAGISVLAQANALPQQVLALLQ